jgi:hypothetical protein
MAVCSLYEITSFLNPCQKVPVYFAVEQLYFYAGQFPGRKNCAYLLIADRLIVRRIILTFKQANTIIKGLCYYFCKTHPAHASMSHCAGAPRPMRIGVVVHVTLLIVAVFLQFCLSLNGWSLRLGYPNNPDKHRVCCGIFRWLL